MTKEAIIEITNPDWFDPSKPEDRIQFMALLQLLGETEPTELLQEVYNEWENKQ